MYVCVRVSVVVCVYVSLHNSLEGKGLPFIIYNACLYVYLFIKPINLILKYNFQKYCKYKINIDRKILRY